MSVDEVQPRDTEIIEALSGIVVDPSTDHEHVAFGCCCEFDHRADHLAVE